MTGNVIFDGWRTAVDDPAALLEATNQVLCLTGLQEITLDVFPAERCLPFHEVEFVLVPGRMHSPEFYRDAPCARMNDTRRGAGKPAIRLNDESRELRWASPADAPKVSLTPAPLRLIGAVEDRGGNTTLDRSLPVQDPNAPPDLMVAASLHGPARH